MKLRLAIVGVGDVAQRDYLPELGRLADRVEPVVACSRTADRARDVAERFQIPRWTTSYDEAVNADAVDAVLNLTPFSLHVDVTLAALAAGKHVYSEKPLALTSSDVGAIAREAERSGCVVVAAPCVMLFPQMRRAKEVVASGELGRVLTARGHGQGGIPPWDGYLSDPAPYFARDGGPLRDMAVYPLHALTGLLGPVREVFAFSARTRDSFEIADGPFAGTSIPVEAADNWHLVLRLADGTLASVEANNCAAGAIAPELELRGELGALGASLLDVSAPLRLQVAGDDRTELVPHERSAGPDHVLGVEHLADCVQEGLEPTVNITHARHVIEVLEASALSATEGRSVPVDSDVRSAASSLEEGATVSAERAQAPLRIGVVGVGALSLRGILPHLTQADVSGRVIVAGLCDPVKERARGAAERFGVPKVFTSLEDMCGSGEVDAVTIASPIGLHFDHCRLALEAELHVHVCKTLSTTVAEADQLIVLARDRGLRLVASPGEVLRPQLTRTRELVASGAIGDVAWAICGGAFEAYHESEEPERLEAPGGLAINPAWYFRKPGGGPMYDITVYALHQLTSVLGPAQRVTALSGIRVPSREFQGEQITTEADDNTLLLLDFGGGMFAVAFGTASGAVSEQFGACIFFGSRGTIDGVLLNGEPFDYSGREATLHGPITDWDAQMCVLEHVVGAHRQIPEAHVFEDIMQLVRWVLDGVPSVVTAEHARHVVDIIESGYRSAATSSTQALSTTFTLPHVAVPVATP